MPSSFILYRCCLWRAFRRESCMHLRKSHQPHASCDTIQRHTVTMLPLQRFGENRHHLLLVRAPQNFAMGRSKQRLSLNSSTPAVGCHPPRAYLGTLRSNVYSIFIRRLDSVKVLPHDAFQSRSNVPPWTILVVCAGGRQNHFWT